MAQVLGSMLQLAPCPFWRLEAAIAPGPRLPHAVADPLQQQLKPEDVQEEEDGDQPEATMRAQRQRASDNEVPDCAAQLPNCKVALQGRVCHAIHIQCHAGMVILCKSVSG